MGNMDQVYSPDDFRKHAHKVVDMVADYLAKVIDDPQEKTLSWKEPLAQYEYWKDYFQQPINPDPLPLFKEVIARSINIHNKKYMGHQVAVVPPVTSLSALLLSILNNGMGVYEMGMTGNSLEKVVIEKISEKIGFDNHSSGFVVSGGTIGNLTAILAARAAKSNAWSEGNQDRKFSILVSAEAHYSIDRAARILGLGSEAVLKVPVDENYQIKIDELERVYTQATTDNKIIICLVGCACSTATGIYDDLESLGKFCQKNNIWFHVDGAHGGAAIYSSKYNHLLKGIQLANSVIIDFHKMMMTPSLSTALLFKNESDSYKTFSQKASYLWDNEENHDWYNSAMRTMECTKSMSILNVYTLFKCYGEQVFSDNIDMLFGLAETLHILLEQNNNFEIAVTPQSNIVCFRYQLPGKDSNNLNAFIYKEITKQGVFYITQTSLNSNIYLRVSLMNPLTGEKELKFLIDTISKIASTFK